MTLEISKKHPCLNFFETKKILQLTTLIMKHEEEGKTKVIQEI